MQSVRKRLEEQEFDILSVRAAKAALSAGRARPEEECEVRTCYQRDRDRIIHANSFRRLKHKTQVFLSPEGDHYRTRLTHTLEVSQIARTMARALRLNEDLTEAVAMGHDLGHTPFGHAGEAALSRLIAGGFSHNEQSLRVVDKLEKDGRGLNLTAEVRDGILCHTGGKRPGTLEGRLVALSDRIAYINHDIDDALRASILSESDIPKEPCAVLGFTKKDRINRAVLDVIRESEDRDDVGMSAEVREAMDELRAFMFRTVYRDNAAKSQEGKAKELLALLFKHFIEAPSELPPAFQRIRQAEGLERAVCDYIAGMTDRYAEFAFKSIYLPENWGVV